MNGHIPRRRHGRTGNGGGFLVALEGIDGAGKTTAAKEAAKELRREGYAAVAAERSTGAEDGYVAGHMSALRAVIWDEPPDAPYLALGDEHWVHLQAAWYSAFARCIAGPLVQAGHIVIADTWGYKFLAKLRLRPPDAVDFGHAWSIFTALPQPELVVHLRADPAAAAARKPTISGSETGGPGTQKHVPRKAFAAYQQRLSRVLGDFADQRGWAGLDVSALSPPEAGAALARIIRTFLGGSGPSWRETGEASR